MEFKLWLENIEAIEVPFAKLMGNREKTEEAFREVKDGLTSRTEGPITVSRLDSPRGSFFLMNGYHRAIESILDNNYSIQAIIDQYVPRIERTGGAYNGLIGEKVVISRYIQNL